MRLVSKAAVALVVAGAALTGVPAAQASAAAMPGCSAKPGPNLDNGYGILKGSYNLKGTYYRDSCNVARMRKGTKLYFHCWKRNRHGNLWVYGRIAGTRTYGWTSGANFRSVRGANYFRCDSNKDRDHT
ncbi:hypothetical protein [Nonomuraea sp. NPDC049309]|jgi:hypothetical protein|uniref:hypothetical protein n=1 Tax=Nonomuraea sp. NPDC049309 TaxID=3364350 RepID=UPI0037194778